MTPPRRGLRPKRAPTRLVLVIWAAILASLPAYIFESGLPQPGDLALAAFLGVALLVGFNRLGPAARTSSSRLLLYLAWVTATNLAWFGIEGFNTDFVMSIAFAAFNSIVFIGFLAFCTTDTARVLRWTGFAVALSLVSQGALAILRPDLNNGARLTLLFNNPNQLAYYCLGAATIVLLVNAGVPRSLPRPLVAIALLSGLLATYLTYSRSALGGYLMLCCVPFIRRPGVAIALVIPLAIAGVALENPIQTDAMWQSRIEDAGNQQIGDYIEDRGINRLLNNPEYLLLGSGEGFHHRFHAIGLELHSSFAGILFYYGGIGLSLFLMFMFSLGRRLPLSTTAYIAPTLVYSFFHNGMRFRIFWLMLAVVAAIHQLARSSATQATQAAPPAPATRRVRWPSAGAPRRPRRF